MERQALQDFVSVYRPLEGESAGYELLARSLPEGICEIDVMVPGAYCGACILKVEAAASADPAVISARLNLTTRRLHVVWRGAQDLANRLVAAVEAQGYDVRPFDAAAEKEELRAEERFLLLCLGVAGFAMGNVMLISVGVWTTSAETMGVATRDLMHWISALIALPAVLFSGRPFFRSAIRALCAGRTNMDVPISLALVLAGAMSVYEVIHHGEHVYFDSAVMLIFFLLIGRYLDFRARKNARSTATDLLSSMSGFANILEDGKLRRLPVRELRQGMVVRVAAGEKFPIDGRISEGETEIDTSLVTGETMPRAAAAGEAVFAGTINILAPVSVCVEKAADDSLLADIVRLMEKAAQGQARYVRLADRAARLYTPVVHVCALLAFAGWWWLGGMVWQDALMIAVTVLIITCPCALALAVPVVQILASGRLFGEGILLKSGDALERLAKIDTVFLDKTGTLTLGRPQLVEDAGDPEVFMLAASLASCSQHPLSKALCGHYKGSIAMLREVREVPGCGMRALFGDKEIRLGSRAWCGDSSAPLTEGMELWFTQEGRPPALFRFEDVLRADAREALDELRRTGLKLVMLSGDREAVARRVAEALGIEEYYAECTPVRKYELLEQARGAGRRILMAGDGLNDAPVLAGADVSMAPGTAIDMAQNAADIVFMGQDLRALPEAYRVAVLTQKLVSGNFALAVVYNIIAIPLALAGWVTPLVAAVSMSASSLIVIANSFRMRLRR